MWMKWYNSITLLLMSASSLQLQEQEQYCSKHDKTCEFSSTDFKDFRYIFYDVNRPEGFNLRRDVYLRMATFVNLLNRTNKSHYKLVLPPWSDLIHWKSDNINQALISWDNFFDLYSLNNYVPIIEMKEYLSFHNIWRKTEPVIDEVFILKHYKEMFDSGNFVDKFEYEEQCPEKDQDIYFWGYNNVTYNSAYCVKFQGPISLLKSIVTKRTARTIMFTHAEIPLHDTWGSPEYWNARRSMRFNTKLVKLADEFRERYLNSTNNKENVFRPFDWRNEKATRKAVGGNYLAVHLRRSDFLWGRADHIPSIPYAAKQIATIAEKHGLNTVFLATDASQKEINNLKSLLEPDIRVLRFIPNQKIKMDIRDGGSAIIDQIICSHAKYFVGTYESTFSFRIQEEREIIGFPGSTTFNRLCGDKEIDKKCSASTQWNILY